MLEVAMRTQRWRFGVAGALAALAWMGGVGMAAAQLPGVGVPGAGVIRPSAGAVERELQAAQDRINALQDDVEHFRARAAGAEKWLDIIEKQIEQTLITPMAAGWREQAKMQ